MEALRNASTRVILAEDGDLIVIILDTKDPRNSKEFSVNSRPLSGSSSKWHDLVSATQDGMIFLTGNPQHHQLLLSIIHKRLETLPRHVSEKDLFELTLVAEEYQVTHLVGPLVTGWSPRPQHWPVSMHYGRDIDGELARVQKRLWVAWVFGQTALFRNLINILVRVVVVDEKKDLFLEGVNLSVVRETHNIPVIPGLFGKL